MILSDKEIKKRIIDDLYWDTSIDASKILVLVDRGKVTLTGTVPSYTAKNRATDAAYRIPDVTRVDNRLTVKFPASYAIPGDDEIRQTVVRSLAANPDTEKTDIHVLVKNGRVTLEGSVDQLWKKGEVGRIACRSRGLCDLINKITVVPTRSIADMAIADEVRAAIERKLVVRIEDVTIKVANGIVTLSGIVPNLDARRAVMDAAEFSNGATEVIDNMVVLQPGASTAAG